MSLDALRANALSHLVSRTVRIPVCTDPEVRDELAVLEALMRTTAESVASHVPDADASPRRSLADDVTITDRAQAARTALEPLEQRVADVMAAAVAADHVVIVAFGVAPAAAESPAAYYEQVAGAHDNRTAQARAIMRDLTRASYQRTESPAGDDLDLTWEQVSSLVMSHADLEAADAAVLELYRGRVSIPFDPSTYGGPATS